MYKPQIIQVCDGNADMLLGLPVITCPDFPLQMLTLSDLPSIFLSEWTSCSLLQGDLPDPGIEPASLAFPTLAGRSLPLAPPGKPCNQIIMMKIRTLNWQSKFRFHQLSFYTCFIPVPDPIEELWSYAIQTLH